MISSSNDLENLENGENMNKVLLEDKSTHYSNHKIPPIFVNIGLLIIILLIIALTVVFFTTLFSK
jgi:hypothetical protein